MPFDSWPDDVAAAMSQAGAGLGPFASLHYRAEASSTNDVALALAMAGAPEGTAVLADRQTSGRGRRGREWFSPAGAGLYLSVVVRPPEASRALSFVTLGAGAAAAAAVREITGLPVELKWPNDLVIGRPWRKLGGLLSEAASTAGRFDAIVLGIGINLRQLRYPLEIADRATALEAELGRPVDRGWLLVELLRQVRAVMDLLHANDAEAVRQQWCRFGGAGLAGSVVRWRQAAGVLRGRVRDIDRDGALLVDVGGRLERIVAGEVLWETVGE